MREMMPGRSIEGRDQYETPPETVASPREGSRNRRVGGNPFADGTGQVDEFAAAFRRAFAGKSRSPECRRAERQLGG